VEIVTQIGLIGILLVPGSLIYGMLLC